MSEKENTCSRRNFLKSAGAAGVGAPFLPAKDASVQKTQVTVPVHLDRDRARHLFNEIPPDVRARIPHLNYSMAEQRCPQRMPIAKLMREAVEELA